MRLLRSVLTKGDTGILQLRGENLHLTVPDISRGSFSRTLLRTNTSLGFQVRIFDIYFDCCGSIIISIGTGSDRRNIATNSYNTADLFVTTNEMWVDVIGGAEYSYMYGYVEIDVTSVTLPGIDQSKILSMLSIKNTNI